jgi:UrcA family protein
MQKLAISIMGTAVLLASGQARADEAPVVVAGGAPTAKVSYADLNLTSAAGRQSLNRRVAAAARGLCFDNTGGHLAEFVAQHQCYSSTMIRARIDIQRVVASATTQIALGGTMDVERK